MQIDLRGLSVLRGTLPRRAIWLLSSSGQHSAVMTDGGLESMQSTANTETDRVLEIVPEISHRVPWRVTSVVVLPDAQLDVSFVDGTGLMVPTSRRTRCTTRFVRVEFGL